MLTGEITNVASEDSISENIPSISDPSTSSMSESSKSEENVFDVIASNALRSVYGPLGY